MRVRGTQRVKELLIPRLFFFPNTYIRFITCFSIPITTTTTPTTTSIVLIQQNLVNKIRFVATSMTQTDQISKDDGQKDSDEA